jgi:2-haloacid dehalogenase
MVPGEIEGSIAILAELRARGVPVFAITNFSAEKYAETLTRFPFLRDFREVIVSAHEQLIKPDPAIYRLLLDRHGLTADHCLFVDDSPANTRGAEAVGMRGHLFRDAPTLRAELSALGLLR